MRKSSGSSVASSPAQRNNSLSGFLGGGSKPKQRGAASVAGDQIAISKESFLTGEFYYRADGKKVRRVKKSSLPSDENVEIITRPDGTKVRRIRKTKPKPIAEYTAESTPTESTKATGLESSMNPPKEEMPRTLSGFLNEDNKSSDSKKKPFSGSHSVAGDRHADNEIYVRADGKKVRRVRKVKPIGDDPKTLSSFLDTETATKPKSSGAATVVGDTRPKTEVSDKPEMEIYVRPDGKVGENNSTCCNILRPYGFLTPLFVLSRKSDEYGRQLPKLVPRKQKRILSGDSSRKANHQSKRNMGGVIQWQAIRSQLVKRNH